MASYSARAARHMWSLVISLLGIGAFPDRESALRLITAVALQTLEM